MYDLYIMEIIYLIFRIWITRLYYWNSEKFYNIYNYETYVNRNRYYKISIWVKILPIFFYGENHSSTNKTSCFWISVHGSGLYIFGFMIFQKLAFSNYRPNNIKYVCRTWHIWLFLFFNGEEMEGMLAPTKAIGDRTQDCKQTTIFF